MRPWKCRLARVYGLLVHGVSEIALLVIESLFTFLVEARYLAGNPLTLHRHRQRKVQTDTVIERVLDRETTEFLVDYLEDLPDETPRERDEKARLQFLFVLLYTLGPRLTEIAKSQMNSFREHRGRWWWHVVGKGDKAARVPVPQACLEALQRYRLYHGLSPLPSPSDETPLLRTIKGSRGIEARTIFDLVKKTVVDAAKAMAPFDSDRATHLARCSTHWLRHTAITRWAERH